MQLDFRTLELFHRMARKGVDSSASRLNQIDGVDAKVAVTRIQFVTPDLLGNSLEDTEHLAVNVEMNGGITGQSYVVFQRQEANDLTRNVEDSLAKFVDENEPETADEMLTELGHIMNCGFIDGWANVIHRAIDVSPPRASIGRDADSLFSEVDTFDVSNLGIVFRSQIELSDTRLEFQHYLFPSVDDLDGLLREDRDSGEQFEIEKIHGFDQMVQEGAEDAADRMSNMTGVDVGMSVRNLNFIPVASIPDGIDTREVVGVAFAFDGLPSGYMVFVFDEQSASEIVSEMTHGDTSEPYSGLGKEALEELGNIMASGLIDGWSNVLDTMVNHSTPEFVHDDENRILDSIVAQVGQHQDYAFLFDTVVEAQGAGEFNCKIYSICQEGDLERALSQLDIDDIDSENLNPSFPLAKQSPQGD